MNDVVIAIIGSGALSALISGCISLMKDRKTKDDGVRAGVRMMLYDRIKFLGLKYIQHGSIDPEQLEDIIEMHKIYHTDLGGNGYLDSVMGQVKALPMRQEKW